MEKVVVCAAEILAAGGAKLRDRLAATLLYPPHPSRPPKPADVTNFHFLTRLDLDARLAGCPRRGVDFHGLNEPCSGLSLGPSMSRSLPVGFRFRTGYSVLLGLQVRIGS